jgi:hypothetical protein
VAVLDGLARAAAQWQTLARPMSSSPYEHCLIAMKRLLDEVGETHWAAWLETDIHEWRASSGTAHHLSAYGGMGSFNDVLLLAANGHNVSAQQEPWANTVFEWLKACCHHLAQSPSTPTSSANLVATVGRHAPSLSAFLGCNAAPNSIRGRFRGTTTMTGTRCLTCGHAEVTSSQVDAAIAGVLVPSLLFDAIEDGTLTSAVERVLRLDVPHLNAARSAMHSAAKSSGIAVRDIAHWMRPCPTCGSSDTAVYRWNLRETTPPELIPAPDNLPLRARAKNAAVVRKYFPGKFGFIILILLAAIFAVLWMIR